MGLVNTGPAPCSPSSPGPEPGLRRTLGVGVADAVSDAVSGGGGGVSASSGSEPGSSPGPLILSLRLGPRRTLPESGLGVLLGGMARGEAGRELGSKVVVETCSLLCCFI